MNLLKTPDEAVSPNEKLEGANVKSEPIQKSGYVIRQHWRHPTCIYSISRERRISEGDAEANRFEQQQTRHVDRHTLTGGNRHVNAVMLANWEVDDHTATTSAGSVTSTHYTVSAHSVDRHCVSADTVDNNQMTAAWTGSKIQNRQQAATCKHNEVGSPQLIRSNP